jgi:hypothetical protein
MSKDDDKPKSTGFRISGIKNVIAHGNKSFGHDVGFDIKNVENLDAEKNVSIGHEKKPRKAWHETAWGKVVIGVVVILVATALIAGITHYL